MDQVGSFKRGKLEDGRTFLEVVNGTMKNHQGTLSTVDKELLKQQIVEHNNPRYYPINVV